MLFCHKIHHIWMINALLLQNLVAQIYALFPPIFLGWQIVSANFFAFWMYGLDIDRYPKVPKCPLFNQLAIKITNKSPNGFTGSICLLAIISPDIPDIRYIQYTRYIRNIQYTLFIAISVSGNFPLNMNMS